MLVQNSISYDEISKIVWTKNIGRNEMDGKHLETTNFNVGARESIV